MAMKTWRLRLKILWKNIQLARNPERTDLVFDLGDALYQLGSFADARKRLLSEPSAKLVVSERKLLRPIDLDHLLLLPPGSLGQAFGLHMKTLNLDPNFFRVRPITDDISFIMMRLRQTHDLWHVVTGFKTDVPGEISLQAFMVSYLYSPLSILLVGASMLKVVLTQPTKIGEMIDAIVQGITRGQKVSGLFGFDWEANWHRPLSEIQSELNL